MGDIDAYQLPDAKGYSAMVRHLLGVSDEERQERREQILATSNKDFKWVDLAGRAVVWAYGERGSVCGEWVPCMRLPAACVPCPPWLQGSEETAKARGLHGGLHSVSSPALRMLVVAGVAGMGGHVVQWYLCAPRATSHARLAPALRPSPWYHTTK